MRIRMKARAAGAVPGRVLQPGDVVEVDDELALVWIDLGYAEPAPGAEVERAVIEPGEQAVARTARTGGSRKKGRRQGRQAEVDDEQ
jgi:hypothetical protein